jgi:DNA gyrase subunit A
MQSISKSSRNTSGVYIVKGDDVVSISRCPKKETPANEDDDESDLEDIQIEPEQKSFDLE